MALKLVFVYKWQAAAEELLLSDKMINFGQSYYFAELTSDWGSNIIHNKHFCEGVFSMSALPPHTQMGVGRERTVHVYTDMA